MKLIKIHKSYSSGSRDLFIFLPDDICLNEDGSIDNGNIDNYVEEECYRDPSGANNGWSADWEIVSDQELINKEAEKKLKYINRSIEDLIQEKEDISKLIKK